MKREEWEAERATWHYIPIRHQHKPGLFESWPELWRFLVYVGGTLLAAAVVGYGLSVLEFGTWVHLR